MDTKSRKLVQNRFLKFLAFALAVICTTALCMMTFSAGNGEIFIGPVFEAQYADSEYFASEMYARARDVNQLITFYKSEENIRAGGTISQQRLEGEMRDLYRGDLEVSDTQVYEELAEQARQSIIRDDLATYQRIWDMLLAEPGIYYYASNGSEAYTNSPDESLAFFESQPVYSVYDKGAITYSRSEKGTPHNYVSERADDLDTTDDVVYLAASRDYLDQMQSQWNSRRTTLTDWMQFVVVCALALLTAVVFLCFGAGHRKKTEGIYHLAVDRMYTDINLVLIAGISALGASGAYALYTEAMLGNLAVLVLVASSVVVLALFLSLVRHFKSKTLLRHSLVFQLLRLAAKLCRQIAGLFRKIAGCFSAFLNSRPYTKKMVFITIGYSLLLCLSVLVFPVAVLLIAGAVWYVVTKCRDFNSISGGAEKIRAGELGHKIAVKDKSELARLAGDINGIAEGLSASIENQLKSERLKTELITNVSHDIRTPLTSIITYVDLLKKEGPQSENAPKYIEVLDKKSARLKVLTDDLFEAAKASSGNIKADVAPMDLCSLVTQSFGELDDKIKASNLEFKLTLPESAYVLADGRLMWRVIENLMSNVFKYAMENSRVYVEVEDLGPKVRLVMKNISASELNVDPDELMQRFKRGDEARHSEGSGLGLAIAKSFVDAQGGAFSLEVDGDLFKAIVTLTKAVKPPADPRQGNPLQATPLQGNPLQGREKRPKSLETPH